MDFHLARSIPPLGLGVRPWRMKGYIHPLVLPSLRTHTKSALRELSELNPRDSREDHTPSVATRTLPGGGAVSV